MKKLFLLLFAFLFVNTCFAAKFKLVEGNDAPIKKSGTKLFAQFDYSKLGIFKNPNDQETYDCLMKQTEKTELVKKCESEFCREFNKGCDQTKFVDDKEQSDYTVVIKFLSIHVGNIWISGEIQGTIDVIDNKTGEKIASYAYTSIDCVSPTAVAPDKNLENGYEHVAEAFAKKIDD